jgi:hypothetical protein
MPIAEKYRDDEKMVAAVSVASISLSSSFFPGR